MLIARVDPGVQVYAFTSADSCEAFPMKFSTTLIATAYQVIPQMVR